MNDGTKFYKIKTIKKLLIYTTQLRTQLLDELVAHATNPVIIKRRMRMLRHVNIYENQLLEKIQAFETNDIRDLAEFDPVKNFNYSVNRSA